MNEIVEFFSKLFDTAGWPPRWHCGRWTDFHGWFYIVSDLMIWSAYFAIPLLILKFAARKRDPRFLRVYFLFAAFILACGSTHFLDAVMFWFPAYRINALVRFFTGVISWVTVFNLVKILPVAFNLKSGEDLQAEVEQRRRTEEELIFKNQQLNEAQDIARIGHWVWEVGANKVSWSDSMFKIYGLQPQSEDISYERFLSKTIEEDREYVDLTIRKAFEFKQFPEYYHRIQMPDGQIITLHAKGHVAIDENGNVTRMFGTAQDVTEQKKAELELLNKSKELEATNEELQKFAYVASHDLQEPLRKIITFSSLLEKECAPEIGARGSEFVQKIVSASGRMQQLISDVLDFSQLSSEAASFQSTDLNKVVANVISDMEINIEKVKAIIKVDPLPTIEANSTQMTQLFQNLLSNALKFRREGENPVINVTSKVLSGNDGQQTQAAARFSILGNPKFWSNELFVEIAVSDNGIGFKEEYADKIFSLFQRLHTRSSYEGTGIGLSICKKIVDNHNGSIRAESYPGKGSTFIFKLPMSQRKFVNEN